jgi:tetratricopeptide (TPR) repeat protein
MMLLSLSGPGSAPPGAPLRCQVHRRLRLLSLGFLWLCWAWGLACPTPSLGAAEVAGRLVYLQGQVAVARAGTATWQAAALNQELLAGDAVKTGPESRCAILGADESQIKLNENTLLVLASVAPSPRLGLAEVQPAAAGAAPRSTYRVPQGEIWLRNSKEKFPLAVETPAVTAAIRGTEFNLQVARDGSSYLTLLAGSLQLLNDYGQVVLQPGEEGMARPGQAPSKRVLVQPADAVQWSLYYPGIFSFRDLPLAPAAGEPRRSGGGAAVLVAQAAAAYDRGELEQARGAAEAALKLEPENPGALTILGWLSLQREDPQAAAGYFTRVKPLEARAAAGLALARYRQGDVAGAYRFLQGVRRTLPPSPLLATLSGFLELMVGKVAAATATLQGVLARNPGEVLARTLLAQIYLVQNHQDRARREAAQALGQAPGSPMAQLTMGLVKIAYFDLPGAAGHLKAALAADPRFVPAYVYLAKIQLGGNYLDRAWETIQRALKLAPRDVEVLTLAGFVRLAFRDYGPARSFFEQAVQANPGLGEPQLGLGIIHFRYRELSQGVAAMLTATLLEPRISAYQSELGKSLYQVRAFDKALATYDYAKTLDKNDPTPYLYKGIALTDLNRPAEAVQEINRSLELNDNRAVLRSRLMLDRDRAVENYNLARAYTELGLGEWAYSKAVTAVKKAPTESSAYIFLADSYVATRQRLGAGGTAFLLYKLLSPANQSTFSLYNDYTPMFEMPYWRALAQGGIGSWQERQTIQEHSLEVYGGLPGLAFDVGGFYNEDRGFRFHNGADKNYTFTGLLKAEPTVKHSLLFTYSFYDDQQGDTRNLNDYGYNNSPFFRQNYRNRAMELGYVYRYNPNATLLTYYNYSVVDSRSNNPTFGSGQSPFTYPPVPVSPPFPPGYTTVDSGYDTYDFKDFLLQNISHETHNAQIQQQLIVDKHTFIGGFDYFSGHLKFRSAEQYRLLVKSYFNLTSTLFDASGNPVFTISNPYTLPLNIPLAVNSNFAYRPPDRSATFYLLDYWNVTPNLMIEMGVLKDIAKSSRVGFATPVYNNKWGGRFGINYLVGDKHTLRLALQEHVATHFISVSPSLIPPEVASFPWQINVDDGSLIREAGFAWEAQWTPKTFGVLRLDAHRISTAQYEVDANLVEHRAQWLWKRYLASYTLNQIIGRYWGLALAGWAKKIDPNFVGSFDFKEYGGAGQLIFWHPSGFRAGVSSFLIRQDLTNRGDNLFDLLNAVVGYEFPGKRGLASLEVDNLLNRHFFYQKEFVTLDAFYPARRILFKLALYF